MTLDKKKMGMDSLRKNTTQRANTINPEQEDDVTKSTPNDPIIKKVTSDKKVLLPKSIRISERTHAVISTISTIEDKKIYEVIDDVVEIYVQEMTSSSRKLIKDSLKAKGL